MYIMCVYMYIYVCVCLCFNKGLAEMVALQEVCVSCMYVYYVCIYVYIYVCVCLCFNKGLAEMVALQEVCVSSMYVYYVCIYVYIYICVCVCLCFNACILVPISEYLCMYARDIQHTNIPSHVKQNINQTANTTNSPRRHATQKSLAVPRARRPSSTISQTRVTKLRTYDLVMKHTFRKQGSLGGLGTAMRGCGL
jgi:hypothetical protein